MRKQMCVRIALTGFLMEFDGNVKRTSSGDTVNKTKDEGYVFYSPSRLSEIKKSNTDCPFYVHTIMEDVEKEKQRSSVTFEL